MLECKDITKIYTGKRGIVPAVAGINIQFTPGEFTVLYGKSGSGKTTLLMILAAMLSPTAGNVVWNGKDLYQFNRQSRAQFRANHIGFIFQMFHLIPYLNVVENIKLAALRVTRPQIEPGITKLLDRLALTDRAYHKPSQLSAGEKQRVAVARALINSPECILADEPASNLDTRNTNIVFRCLSNFQAVGGTVIMATQRDEAKDFAGRILRLDKGRLQDI